MEQKKQEPIRDARHLGTAKMLILGLQHMFAMFGATILVPILIRIFSEGLWGAAYQRSFCIGYPILRRLWHAYISSVYKV